MAGSLWETYEVNAPGQQVRKALGLLAQPTFWPTVLRILGISALRRSWAIRKGQKQYENFKNRQKGFK